MNAVNGIPKAERPSTMLLSHPTKAPCLSEAMGQHWATHLWYQPDGSFILTDMNVTKTTTGMDWVRANSIKRLVGQVTCWTFNYSRPQFSQL